MVELMEGLAQFLLTVEKEGNVSIRVHTERISQRAYIVEILNPDGSYRERFAPYYADSCEHAAISGFRSVFYADDPIGEIMVNVTPILLDGDPERFYLGKAFEARKAY